MLIIRNYDQWKTASPYDEMKVVGECDWCGGEIYEQDEIYVTKEGNIHKEECFKELAIEKLEAEESNGEKLLQFKEDVEAEMQMERMREYEINEMNKIDKTNNNIHI